MADNALQEYTVTINGIEHTMLLDDATAKQYGDAAKRSTASVTNKSRSATSDKSRS